MNFKTWLEGQTYAHDLKIVYHWDIESDWHKILRKQGQSSMRKNKVYALWVSPNKHMNEYWARWIVSANDEKTNFYLHKIGVPRDLYTKYLEKSKLEWHPKTPMEFVINQKDWDQLTPINYVKYSRKDCLKLAFRANRRQEIHQKWHHGALNKAPGDHDKTVDWQMGYNSNKKPEPGDFF